MAERIGDVFFKEEGVEEVGTRFNTKDSKYTQSIVGEEISHRNLMPTATNATTLTRGEVQ